MQDRTYREEQVSVQGEYQLKGTLTIPDGTKDKCPAVLFITGSGIVDRNGYAAKAKIVFNAYTELADLITRLGFITLRFDKRGVGESGGKYFEAGLWDRIRDIELLVEYLRKDPRVDPEKVILLGHSEGSMLSSIVNARKPVSGMVLLSGAAETLTQATARQRELACTEMMSSQGIKGFLFRLIKADKKAMKQNEKFTEKIMKGTKDIIRINFVKVNAKWLREHFSYNVIDDLKKAVCPVLAITGAKDSQANPERVKEVPQLVKGEGEYHIIENMDHSLKEFSGSISVMNALKQYKKSQEQSVHPELKKILSEWLVRHYCDMPVAI